MLTAYVEKLAFFFPLISLGVVLGGFKLSWEQFYLLFIISLRAYLRFHIKVVSAGSSSQPVQLGMHLKSHWLVVANKEVVY